MKLSTRIASALVISLSVTPINLFADVALYTLKTESATPINMLSSDLDNDRAADFVVAGKAIGQSSILKRISERGDQVVWSLNAAQLDLPSPNNFTANDLGHALKIVPDLNFDGVQDILVSSPNINHPNQKGDIFLISGRDGSLLRRFNQHGFPGDKIGESLADMGNNRFAACGSGKVSTALTVPARCIIFDLNNGAVIVQKIWETGAGFGASLATIGDLNGDGISELAIGEPRRHRQTPGSTTYLNGRVEIVSGANLSLMQEIWGAPQNLFGSRIVTLGDINNNGSIEIMISSLGYGAPLNRVSIFSVTQQTSSLIREHLASSATASSFGSALAAIGDQDGDGIVDYAIGEPRFQNIYGDAGRVLVYSGRTGLTIETIAGRKASYEFGATLASMSDVSQDGKADLLIGSATGYLNSGVATVFSTDDFARVPSMVCDGEKEESMKMSMSPSLAINTSLNASVALPSLAGQFVLFLVGEVGVNFGPSAFQGCASPLALFGHSNTWHLQHFVLADSSGIAHLSLPIPNDPALVGERLTVQAISFDSKGNLITSEACALKIN